MEQDIFCAITHKIQDEQLPVTYSWLQQKFDISPHQTQIYLEKYISINDDVNATYISFVKDQDMNLELTRINSRSNDSIIFSLSSIAQQDFKIEHFDSISSDSSEPKKYLLFSEDVKLRSPLSTFEDDKIGVETHCSDKTIKIEKKPFVENSLFEKKTCSETTVKTSFKKSKKSPPVKSSLKKSNIENSKQGTLDLFKLKNSNPKLVSVKVENDETPGISKCLSQEKSCRDTSTKTEQISCKDPCLMTSDSDFDLMEDDFFEDTNTETQTMKNPTDNSKTQSKNVSKKSPKSDEVPKKCNLFDDESDFQSKKRKRIVMESDDEEEENCTVLVNDSLEIPEKSSKNKSNPSKKPKTVETTTNRTQKEVKSEKVVSNRHITMTKVEKTFQDDEGFLVVEKVLVPVNNSDKLAVKPVRAASPPKLVKKTKNSLVKDSKNKQTNILSFFHKNN